MWTDFYNLANAPKKKRIGFESVLNTKHKEFGLDRCSTFNIILVLMSKNITYSNPMFPLNLKSRMMSSI